MFESRLTGRRDSWALCPWSCECWSVKFAVINSVSYSVYYRRYVLLFDCSRDRCLLATCRPWVAEVDIITVIIIIIITTTIRRTTHSQVAPVTLLVPTVTHTSTLTPTATTTATPVDLPMFPHFGLFLLPHHFVHFIRSKYLPFSSS